MTLTDETGTKESHEFTSRRPAGGLRAERTMDRVEDCLERVRSAGIVAGRLRGFLHIFIGRSVKADDGTVVSAGMTWRALSHYLKTTKFDKDLVREFGADPDEISPRDRERFWYSAIALARPDSQEALAQAEALVPLFAKLGFVVGPAPAGLAESAQPVPIPRAAIPARTKPKRKP
jgi:hypothetical protein